MLELKMIHSLALKHLGPIFGYRNEVNTLNCGEETMCQWTHLVLVFGFTNPPREGSTLSPAHAATPQGEPLGSQLLLEVLGWSQMLGAT